MQKYLPSKKFIIIVLIIVAVIGIVILIFSVSGKKISFKQKISNSGLLEVKPVSLRDIIDQDTDKDGIPDWEEALWGTNPYKKDTNDDGISDNVEIEKKKQALQLKLPRDSDQELTETDIFAREFFASLVALKQSGNLGAGVIEDISYSLGQSLATGEIFDPYQLSDLTIDYVTLESYYQNVKIVSQKYTGENMGRELEILEESIHTNNPSSLNELLDIAYAYKSFAEDLKKITVPRSAAIDHLYLINNTIKISEAVKNLSYVFNDPLVGVRGISQYRKYSSEFEKALSNLEESGYF